MQPPPFISICVPAFKRTEFLERLLDSIVNQSFRDFEVVVTDDSPDEQVEMLCKKYENHFPLVYIRNPSALGTPENWNQAIRNARGQWIKIMHDDDWFANDNALQVFYNAVQNNPGKDFLFAAYRNVDIDLGKQEIVKCSVWDLAVLRFSYLHLFKKNYVGNPSCTLIRRNELQYDSRLKFVVDFEYYIQCFKNGMRWNYIDEVLLTVGINAEQVTKYTFMVAAVQIPENHLIIEKMGAGILKNIMVYDYYWRMYRNLGIRSIGELKRYKNEDPHPSLKQMIVFQQSIPGSLLKIGLISKLLMLLNYLRNLIRFV